MSFRNYLIYSQEFYPKFCHMCGFISELSYSIGLSVPCSLKHVYFLIFIIFIFFIIFLNQGLDQKDLGPHERRRGVGFP